MTNRNENLAINLRNVNRNNGFIELLDALKRHGPRNLSLISMLTGIPHETVRYKVKKQLRELGFRIQMIPNIYKMGLTRLFARLTFTGPGLKLARELLDELGRNSYLSYYGKIAFSSDFLVMINPPSKWANMFGEFFKELSEEEIIKSYEISEVKEVGYPHVTYRLFDFERGVWRLNEGDSPRSEGIVVVQKASQAERANYLIDSTDLAIITQLQGDAFAPLTKVSSSIGRDPRLLRYHFQEHIVRKGLIAGYVLNWFPRGDDSPHLSRLWIRTDPIPTRKIDEFTKDITSSPFCKFYQILEDNTLLIYLLIDRQFTPAVKHLSEVFAKHDIGGEQLIVEDVDSYSLTRELFKDEFGWLRPIMPRINAIMREG